MLLEVLNTLVKKFFDQFGKRYYRQPLPNKKKDYVVVPIQF